MHRHLSSSPWSPARFSEAERRLLLMAKGIGERTVDLLEATGYTSLEALSRRGAAGVADDVATITGSDAWRCRVRHLERMLVERDRA